jgi:hypothetical protein
MKLVTENHISCIEKVSMVSPIHPSKDGFKAVPETFQEILWTPVRYCV